MKLRSLLCPVLGRDKRTASRICHYRSVQNRSIALKTPCCPSLSCLATTGLLDAPLVLPLSGWRTGGTIPWVGNKIPRPPSPRSVRPGCLARTAVSARASLPLSLVSCVHSTQPPEAGHGPRPTQSPPHSVWKPHRTHSLTPRPAPVPAVPCAPAPLRLPPGLCTGCSHRRPTTQSSPPSGPFSCAVSSDTFLLPFPCFAF